MSWSINVIGLGEVAGPEAAAQLAAVPVMLQPEEGMKVKAGEIIAAATAAAPNKNFHIKAAGHMAIGPPFTLPAGGNVSSLHMSLTIDIVHPVPVPPPPPPPPVVSVEV